MLKFKLDSLDGVEESIAAMYEAKDGGFQLKVAGIPQGEDVTGLKAKVQELLDEKKAEADKRKAAEESARTAAEESARKKNDFETLAKSLEQKNLELQSKLEEIQKRDANLAIDSAALKMASELSEGSNVKLMTRFLKDRLRFEDGEVKVTDEKGGLTVSTLEDLAAEFKKNEDFSSLIVATKASGGGATGGSGGAAGKKFNELTTAEKVALHRDSPEEYARLKSASTH